MIVLHLLFGFCCIIKTVLKTDAAASQKKQNMVMQVFSQHFVVYLGSPKQRKRGHQHKSIPIEMSEEKQVC